MINLHTPSEQIMKELFEDEQKAFYWLRKSYHGDKSYERMRDALIAKCRKERKTQVSDVVEYISKNGNRWMVFECCQYYKLSSQVYTMPIAFCYYETLGSVGTYLVSRSIYDVMGKNKSVLHFTNHFFLRFCQRLGVEMRSRWMVQRFVEVIPGFLLGCNGVNENGVERYDVRLPGSIGRGIKYKDAPIIEIRTYLTDKELNKKQLRETQRLREAYTQQTFEPMSVRVERLSKSDNFARDMEAELDNIAHTTGVSRDLLEKEAVLRISIIKALCDLGYSQKYDTNAWIRFGERMADIDFRPFIEGYNNRDKEASVRTLYDIICKVGKVGGFPKYNAKDVMDNVIRRWQKNAENN